MLTAKKSKWFENAFAIYNTNLLKRRFHSFNIAGLENLRLAPAGVPKLVCANHSSWWDGLLAFQISRQAGLDSFVMMDEANLRRFFLFRRLGAFSVADNPRRALASIRYAAGLLKADADRTMWIFPQGSILPNDVRPLHFFSGAARIARQIDKCLIVPAAFRFEIGGNFKPEIFVKIGRGQTVTAGDNFDHKALTANLAKKVETLLDELRSAVIEQKTESFQSLF